jgi:hypothetical protein
VRIVRRSETLLSGLVDDAALFPPGNAAMSRALREHAELRRTPRSGLVGPFLCPVSRVAELTGYLPDDEVLRVSLVADRVGPDLHQALRTTTQDPRLPLAAVEVPLTAVAGNAARIGTNLATHHPHVSGCLEVPRDDIASGLALVGTPGWHLAKYRTGGATPDAFPDEKELATFLVAALDRDVAFKLTAGLHHAVRRTDLETGFEQHGVLNVLAATEAASRGGSIDQVATVLAVRDARELATEVGRWDEETCVRVRDRFRSFGCCGVHDPIDDLTALGLLEDG